MVIKISLLDCRKLKLEDILQSKYISDDDKKAIFKCNNEEVRIEKAALTYLKNKYIGQYFINSNGKPVSDKCYFNISHSGKIVALAIDTVNVGLDIEQIRHIDRKFIEYVTSEDELDYIKDDKNFFEVWTNKEALLKAYGTGINKQMKSVPGLPINGLLTYQNKKYINKTIAYGDYVLTISRESEEDYSLEIAIVNIDN